MFFVYLLKSETNSDVYVGSTEDVKKRVALHNAGRVQSTKPNRPWKLLGTEVYYSRSEAVQRERFLKTGQQKEILKRKYGLVAK